MNTGVRSALTTWLALTALQTLATPGASGRVGSAFNDVNGFINRALSPSIAAIPDRRTGAVDTASTSGSTTRTATPFTTQVPYAAGAAPRFPLLYPTK